MQLKRLVIRNLYGYMNKDIEFKTDINLLVGINGSGKTSVLNVINWILTTNIENLCTVEFKELSLYFVYNNHDSKITCSQTSKKLSIAVSTNKTYNHLSVMLEVPASKITARPQIRKDLSGYYRGLSPDPREVETWQFLRSLPQPFIIGLDRAAAFSDEESIPEYSDNRKVGNKNTHRRVSSSPINKVKELTTKYYSKYRDELINLNNNLKNTIMISSFDVFTNVDDIRSLSSNIISKSKIDSLEKKVDKFFSDNSTISDKFVRENYSKISDYFKWFKDSLKKSADISDNDYSILYFINSSQFKRIKLLVNVFEKYEDESAKAYSRFKTYLDTVNNYFRDTSKLIIFSEQMNELRFQVLDGQEKQKGHDRDIQLLSSGEKQALILLTYLAFQTEGSRLFIVDEPELSLHPKWQDDFLESAKQVMPNNTQLIMATHSPAIVGKNIDNCNVLFPYNVDGKTND